MNGGYVMIDGTGIDLLAESAVTIPGLYAECQKAFATRKPVIVYNVVWGDQGVITPFNIFLIQFEGYIIGTTSTLQVEVTSEDEVTITNMVEGGNT